MRLRHKETGKSIEIGDPDHAEMLLRQGNYEEVKPTTAKKKKAGEKVSLESD